MQIYAKKVPGKRCIEKSMVEAESKPFASEIVLWKSDLKILRTKKEK